MLKPDKEKIRIIADWLDEVNYRMICSCILQHAQLPVNCCFPDFGRAHSIIREENPMYGFIFAFFRLGHSAESVYLQDFIPEKVFHALIDTGLITGNGDDVYKMNHLAILPLGDIYLLSGLPARYPTSDIDNMSGCYFSDEHHLFFEMMQGDIKGDKAIELYGTHGAFGLKCAKNGMETTVCPLDEHYHPMIQYNIYLNRLENKIRIGGIQNVKSQQIKYDFICSVFPLYFDVLYGNNTEITDENCMMNLYSDAFENHLLNMLSPYGLFLCMLQSTGGQYNISFNDNVLTTWNSKNSMNLLVNVLHKDFLPFSMKRMIENSQRSWEKEFGCSTVNMPRNVETFMHLDHVTKRQSRETGYLYTELIRGYRSHSDMPGFTLYPVYNPEKSDFLYQQSQMLNY